jgi:signal transduction histidine kinase
LTPDASIGRWRDVMIPMAADPMVLGPSHVPARHARELSGRSSLLVVLAAVIVAVTSVSLMLTSPWRGDFDETGWWIDLARDLFTIGVGLAAWRARPGNRVGPLLIVLGFAGFVPWLSHSGHPVLWTLGDTWVLAAVVLTANLYLVFPEGRTSGWSRVLVVAVYAWWLVLTTAGLLVREYPSTWPWQNPFLAWPDEALADMVGLVADVGGLVLGVLVVVTVMDKWRRGTALARRALAPVFWVSPITLIVVGTWFVGRIADAEALVALSTGPLAQLTGFLLPTAFLAGLLRTRLDQASIADLVRTLDRVGPGDLEPALAGVVRDPSLRLVFPTSDDPAYVDANGQLVELPTDDMTRAVTLVGPADGPLAMLVHDAAIDPELVASAAAASRLALENARLTAELRAQLEAVRASRLRIIEAADDERRRLERDLHDGAQQRLVVLGFALREATRRVHGDPELRGVLEGAQGELEAGLRELRTIARGLHPSALDDGLGPALRELADRSSLPVAVELDDAALPPSVETTAYYIAAEAMTNALRHAQAERITIRGAVESGRFVLQVHDDGRGGAAEAADGTGLRGLIDRAQALGGSLSIQSPAGGGTVIVATLPLT